MATNIVGCSTRGEYPCSQDRQLPLTAVCLHLLMQRAVLLSLLQMRQVHLLMQGAALLSLLPVSHCVPAWATLRLTYGRAGTV